MRSVSFADRLERRTVEYDPEKDYTDISQLGLLAHQKAKVEEETRAYRAMPAQELARSIQRLLVEANEARRIGTSHIQGPLSGKMLFRICCAMVGVGQLASRVPADEEVKSLKTTVDAFVRVNVELRKRLEQLEAREAQPAPAPAPVPASDEGRKRPRPLSSPEKTSGEKDAGASRRRRVARIESSLSSAPEERMEAEKEGPKPQRTAAERPEPMRADFQKSREVPSAQKIPVFDDTAIREAEKKKKGKKKKKKNPERGEMELFSPTLPELPPPVSKEDPPRSDRVSAGGSEQGGGPG